MDEKSDWLSRTKHKIAVAARKAGMTKNDYWLKYRDEIVRHNRFP